MVGIVRQDDKDSAGHKPKEYSPDVKANGKFVFRHDDKDDAGNIVTSETALNSTAYDVYANGKPVVIRDDKDDAGHTKIEGSSTVLVGPRG